MSLDRSPATKRALELLPGHRPTQVRRLLAEEGYNLSLNALYQINKKYGTPSTNVNASELIPWVLSPQHQHVYAAKRLRDLARKMQRMTLTTRQVMLLENWLEKLRQFDYVIDYHPVWGFEEVPRRYRVNEGGVRIPIDQSVILDPSFDDDGNKITEEWTDQPEETSEGQDVV